jgi:precorrin-2 dehydrogenase/sirohydrochlorin ferrochelatase
MPVEAAQYPVNLVLSGHACLVVGGGSVAARKIDGLLACGAQVRVIATTVGAELRARAVELDEVEVEERPYQRGDVAGSRLVIAATNDPTVNHAVYEDAEAAGIWINSADDPAACTFTLPSVVRRGPIMVTISTGGYSPALSTWLKAHVEERLGPEYEILLDLLSTARNDIKAAGRSTEEADWRTALDSDMLDLIRAGQIDRAKERLQAWLSSSSD